MRRDAADPAIETNVYAYSEEVKQLTEEISSYHIEHWRKFEKEVSITTAFTTLVIAVLWRVCARTLIFLRCKFMLHTTNFKRKQYIRVYRANFRGNATRAKGIKGKTKQPQAMQFKPRRSLSLDRQLIRLNANSTIIS